LYRTLTIGGKKRGGGLERGGNLPPTTRGRKGWELGKQVLKEKARLGQMRGEKKRVN